MLPWYIDALEGGLSICRVGFFYLIKAHWNSLDFIFNFRLQGRHSPVFVQCVSTWKVYCPYSHRLWYTFILSNRQPLLWPSGYEILLSFLTVNLPYGYWAMRYHYLYKRLTFPTAIRLGDTFIFTNSYLPYCHQTMRYCYLY